MDYAIYFDNIPEDLQRIVLENKPEHLMIYFWADLLEQDKESVLKEANYFILTAYPITSDILNQARKLKFIQKVGAGLDNIDLDAAKLLGVKVSNTPGGNSVSVAEATILFILALYRRLIEIDEKTKEGDWLSWEYRSSSFEMKEKTHGLIGIGNIGFETAIRSAAFGTKIVYYDKQRLSIEKEKQLGAEYISLEELLNSADIISLHLPLLPETYHLLSDKELRMVKTHAILINVARGGIVDEEALYHHLKMGSIKGAAIDAWETEPVVPDHSLLMLNNVISTPHIGGGTLDTFQRVINMTFDNITRVNNNQEPNHTVG